MSAGTSAPTGGPPRTTYLLVDGENIDATLGASILRHRPAPDERPRWDRVLDFAGRTWGQPVRGLFFLAANNELPGPFVQALMAMDYRPVPLSGGSGEKIVDIAIQRTLTELARREGDVLLVSHDADFVDQITALVDDGTRRVGVIGFREFRSQAYTPLFERGLDSFDLEFDVRAFRAPLPRVRIIPIDEFDPAEFL
jgi:putative heme uptake system protein